MQCKQGHRRVTYHLPYLLIVNVAEAGTMAHIDAKQIQCPQGKGHLPLTLFCGRIFVSQTIIMLALHFK